MCFPSNFSRLLLPLFIILFFFFLLLCLCLPKTPSTTFAISLLHMCVTFSIHMCIYACLHTSRLIHKLSSTIVQHNPVLAAMGPWGGLHPHCYLGIVVLQSVIPPFYLSALLLSPYFCFCLLSNLSAHWTTSPRGRALLFVCTLSSRRMSRCHYWQRVHSRTQPTFQHFCLVWCARVLSQMRAQTDFFYLLRWTMEDPTWWCKLLMHHMNRIV